MPGDQVRTCVERLPYAHVGREFKVSQHECIKIIINSNNNFNLLSNDSLQFQLKEAKGRQSWEPGGPGRWLSFR